MAMTGQQRTILSDEITNDPLTRVYSGMTDQQVADDLNTVYRTSNKLSMSASEIYNAIDNTEFEALTVAQRDEIYSILQMQPLNPFGFEATRFSTIFGGGSATISSLQTLRLDNISRARELELPPIRVGWVIDVRGG